MNIPPFRFPTMAYLHYMTFLMVLIGAVNCNVQDDLATLVKLFPGKYDNIAQYNYDIKHTPIAKRHLHLITTATPEQVPVLIGYQSFYVEQYLNGNISDVIRQRIYSYGIDAKTNEIVLKLYSFKDPSKFLHAPANSPTFTALTMGDIIYAEGCDVYWTRLSDNYFRSHMFNTCIVNIGGAEVLIIDRNNLTDTYLTADETWVFYKNQSVLKVYPSPYNMTNFPLKHQESVGIPQTHIGDTVKGQLMDFNSLIKALTTGHEVRYFISPDQCQVSSPSGKTMVQGGYIEDFEYFFDPLFGPQHYFGFSTSNVALNKSGELVTVLKEGFVYEQDGVHLRITTLTSDLSIVLDIVTINCSISTFGSSVQFFTGLKQLTPISSTNDLYTALKHGASVRFTADYRGCTGISAGAISGGVIQDYDFVEATQEVAVTQSKLITNYQGAGFATDIVIGQFFGNNSVTFYASDVTVSTHQPVYKENIYCSLSGRNPNGTVNLYQIP
ncbi:hypothetical protein SNE40_000817 [Patella caerulea]|uniref:Uncharacterized protein n=1 Tax=Patella caerulea TaxID=87958 RepID=A0AAN8QAG0_PATCE